MKAPAEKSSRRRRPSSLDGARVNPASARLFQRIAAVGSLVATLALGSAASADEPALAPPAATTAAPASNVSNLPPEELERQAESIARSIMSPFCPGRTVSACPVAGPWRDDIRRWVAEGVDAIEIKRRLAERVPEHNLGGVPKNRLGWVLPVGLGIAALGLLVFLLRRLVGPSAAARAAAAPKVESAKVDGAKVDGASPGKANSAAAPKASAEDYDARLQQELETLEQ